MARTPEHQFIRELVKIYKKSPDDPFYENINPYLKVWLYESWIYEKELESEKLKNLAILIGSFINPEAAQKMVKSQNPDFVATNAEQTAQEIHKEIINEDNNSKKKRKKRKVVE